MALLRCEIDMIIIENRSLDGYEGPLFIET